MLISSETSVTALSGILPPSKYSSESLFVIVNEQQPTLILYKLTIIQCRSNSFKILIIKHHTYLHILAMYVQFLKHAQREIERELLNGHEFLWSESWNCFQNFNKQILMNIHRTIWFDSNARTPRWAIVEIPCLCTGVLHFYWMR